MYLKVPIFFIEDAHTTGFLAEICNIPRRNVIHFQVDRNLGKEKNFRRESVPHMNVYYIYHHVDGDLKLALFKQFLQNKPNDVVSGRS